MYVYIHRYTHTHIYTQIHIYTHEYLKTRKIQPMLIAIISAWGIVGDLSIFVYFYFQRYLQQYISFGLFKSAYKGNPNGIK